MTDRWMVLLWGDEAFWENATPEVQERVMGEHGAFSDACAERGYRSSAARSWDFSKNAVTVRVPRAAS